MYARMPKIFKRNQNSDDETVAVHIEPLNRNTSMDP